LTEDERKILTGWTPLILSMMWESQQPDSLWKEYFDIMPTNFDSLMFWSKAELRQLRGSAVLGELTPFFLSLHMAKQFV
jgi:SET domain-containing protein 6